MGPWTAPTLRQATMRDFPTVLANAAAMQLEEMGRDPLADDPDGFRDRVAARIEAGRTWVLEEEGQIAFQVSIASVGPLGGQLEGVYTHPVFRGLGLASQGLGQLCRTQLARLPRLTLHVAETNREAVGLYRKLGFLPDQPYRVIRAD
jgi:predicted GNAT family acetyltransferase